MVYGTDSKDVYYGCGNRENEKMTANGLRATSRYGQHTSPTRQRTRKRFRKSQEDHHDLDTYKGHGSTRTGSSRGGPQQGSGIARDAAGKRSHEALQWIYPPPSSTNSTAESLMVPVQPVPQASAPLQYWPGTYPICPVPMASVTAPAHSLDKVPPGFVFFAAPSTASTVHNSTKDDHERTAFVRTVINGIPTTVPLPRKSTLVPEDKQTGTLGQSAATRSRGLFKSDDWKCAVCLNINWARRSICNLCRTPRPNNPTSMASLAGHRRRVSSRSHSRSFSRSPSQSPPPRNFARKKFSKNAMMDRTPNSSPNSTSSDRRFDFHQDLDQLEREREPDDRDTSIRPVACQGPTVPPSSPSIYWDPSQLSTLNNLSLTTVPSTSSLHYLPTTSSSSYLGTLSQPVPNTSANVLKTGNTFPAVGTYQLLHQQAIAEYLRVQKVQQDVQNGLTLSSAPVAKDSENKMRSLVKPANNSYLPKT